MTKNVRKLSSLAFLIWLRGIYTHKNCSTTLDCRDNVPYGFGFSYQQQDLHLYQKNRFFNFLSNRDIFQFMLVREQTLLVSKTWVLNEKIYSILWQANWSSFPPFVLLKPWPSDIKQDRTSTAFKKVQELNVNWF